MVHEMTLYLGHGLAQQRVSFSRSVFESFVNGYFAAERGQKKGKASLPLFPSLISALDLLPHFRLSPLQLDPSPLATNLAALSLSLSALARGHFSELHKSAVSGAIHISFLLSHWKAASPKAVQNPALGAFTTS